MGYDKWPAGEGKSALVYACTTVPAIVYSVRIGATCSWKSIGISRNEMIYQIERSSVSAVIMVGEWRNLWTMSVRPCLILGQGRTCMYIVLVAQEDASLFYSENQMEWDCLVAAHCVRVSIAFNTRRVS